MISLRHFWLGVLFALSLAPLCHGGVRFQVLHSFGADGDGTLPYGPPLPYNGNVFGVTITGGTGMCSDYGCGMVYELSPNGNGQWTETSVHDFGNEGDGSLPSGNLIADSAGNLFGTDSGYGSGHGGLFELQPETEGGWSISIIYPGGSPGLTINQSGDIFGLIGGGIYGAMGELSPSDGAFNYTDLYNFCSPDCGQPPYNPVSRDANGNLYGTSYFGGYAAMGCGSLGCGVAYQVSRGATAANGTGWAFHLMHTFGVSPTPNDGLRPQGGMIIDRFGNAFGTTVEGGGCGAPPGCGTVFELSPDPSAPGVWQEKILYDFPGSPPCSRGCGPSFNIVFDEAGNLYGTAGGGSDSCAGSCGIVFKLAPGAGGQWTYSIVHAFSGPDGGSPNGLAMDENGDLFGVTEYGGTYNEGTVFVITP